MHKFSQGFKQELAIGEIWNKKNEIFYSKCLSIIIIICMLYQPCLTMYISIE